MNKRGWGTTRPVKVTTEAFMDLFYKQQLPLREIAKRLKCAVTTLSSFRVNNGLPRRKPIYVNGRPITGQHHSTLSKRKISIARRGKNTGSENWNWKGGSYIDTQGYRWIKSDHGLTSNHGYIKEHRLVMEIHLNRPLSTKEIVHHKNGNRLDNRIENLCIHTQSSHTAEHHRTGTDFSHKHRKH